MAKAASNLVIVESPSKAKTIGKYLGPDYQGQGLHGASARSAQKLSGSRH